jgi:serine/threonine protein kinase
MYSSPEVECRGPHISRPIDMWALGVVATVMAGVPFTEVGDNLSLPQRWKLYLGDPPLELGCSLPGDVPHVPRMVWPAQLVTALGRVGIDLLDRLLTYEPRQRITAAELLDHEFLLDGLFPLVGVRSGGAMRDGEGTPDNTGLKGEDLTQATIMLHGCFPGWYARFCGHPKRHEWSLRLWSMQRDILLWLQKDDMFIQGTPANELVVQLATGKEVISYSSSGKELPRRCHISTTSTGEKVRIGGHLGHPGTTMIKLKIDEACPLARVIDFMKAFHKVNREWLLAMQSKAKAGARRLGTARRGTTATRFSVSL